MPNPASRRSSLSSPSLPSPVVVAGDICLDVVGVPMPRPSSPDAVIPNWRLTGETRTHHLRGGALLLSRWVAEACEGRSVVGPVIPRPVDPSGTRAPDLPLSDEELPGLKRQDLVHSILEAVADGDVARLARAHGYSGPDLGDPRLAPALPGDVPEAGLVVLDDTGNSFRHRRDLWPKALTTPGAKPWVVYKLHRPLPVSDVSDPTFRDSNPLWNEVCRRHGDRLIVIVDADDLRFAGAIVSRGLSWESTALDLVRELAGNATFASLHECRHLIVRFGLDGAVYRMNSGSRRLPEAWLVYDPMGIEGGFLHGHLARRRGGMVGFGSAFVAAVAGRLAAAEREAGGWATSDDAEPPSAIVDGIRCGLGAGRRLLELGFGSIRAPAYPGRDLFAGTTRADFPFLRIPAVTGGRDAGVPWAILDTLLPAGASALEVAMDLVRTGRAAALGAAPLGVFHDLRTYDRAEIETYRAISHLLREYLERPAAKRPLSLAVFGPPGSGKSFAVSEVAESVRGKTVIETLTFNVSQFGDPEELAAALHLVRDQGLRGVVPLVFFDEFDAALRGQKLGWLRYFLAPMQDGEFIDRGAAHPIGKAVFIFAGGTAGTYAEFIRPLPAHRGSAPDSGAPAPKASRREDAQADAFRDCKGPDFVSRLRGHVDVPDIAHDRLPGSVAVLLRRALVLRFQLKTKAAAMMDPAGRVPIDTGVLRAFLQVSHPRHGVRSLVALLEMSSFSGRPSLDASCLPAPDQLTMHAPAQEFLGLARHPSPFGNDVDRVARAIHEIYLKARRRDRTYDPKKRTHQRWDKLPEDVKESNRGQANQIPAQLLSIGLTFEERIGARGAAIRLTARQVEPLARREHERWMAEKRREGWVYGPKRDDRRRIHDCLRPWEELGAAREKDREAVRAIGRHLDAAGFRIVPATRVRAEEG